MKRTLPAVFDYAPGDHALRAALLLSALLLCAPAADAQGAAQTRERPTATPSSTTPANRDAPQSQQQTRDPAQSQRQTAAEPDLSITARVTADSLRFEKVPNPSVEFTGRPRRDAVWESDRENLPQEVRPGVTYRNVGITLRITSVFADIDRIVAEALGEIPASDDTPTQPAPPAQPSPSTPAPSTPAQPPSPEESKREAARKPSPPKAPATAARRAHERRGRGR